LGLTLGHKSTLGTALTPAGRREFAGEVWSGKTQRRRGAEAQSGWDPAPGFNSVLIVGGAAPASALQWWSAI